MSDYYSTLEVDRSATAEEIRKAYRKLATRYHPDKHIGADEETKERAKKKFEEIRNAYEVLNNEEDREIYDKHGADGLKPGNRPRKAPIPPIQVRLGVSLQDCYSGKTVEISVPIEACCDVCAGKGTADGKTPAVCGKSGGCGGQGMVMTMRRVGPGMMQQVVQPCGKCGGAGVLIEEENKCKKCLGKKNVTKKSEFKVEVEPGMRPQQMIVCAERGHSVGKRTPGDVHVILAEKTEKEEEEEEKEEKGEKKEKGEKLTRDESLPCDLNMTKKITLLESLLGFEFSFQHLDGRKIVCRSPADHIFKQGEELLLPGLGMPVWKKFGVYGDLIITFEVSMPSADEIPRLRSPAVTKLLRGIFVPGPHPPPPAAAAAATEELPKDETVMTGTFLSDELNKKRQKQRLVDLGAKRADDDEDDDDENHSGPNVSGAGCRQM